MSDSYLSSIPQRDMRSEATSYKRDRDADEKWSQGTRDLPGQRKYTADPDWPSYLIQEKVRPAKLFPGPPKSHANKTPKPTPQYNWNQHYVRPFPAAGRVVRKVEAIQDANDAASSPLSRSLLELLPQHANNTETSIQTALREHDADVMYSFDNAGASPDARGRVVGLGSLVEQAEKKWDMEQTDKIVKGEYEVLDAQGETTLLSRKKKGSSPKQRAVKASSSIVEDVNVEEDEGFELI